MRWTDLRTGYRCNQQCRFCDQGDAAARLGDAAHEAVVAAMVAIPHREAIILAGGEVTLRPDLPKLVAAARSLGFKRVAVQTNGQVLASSAAAASLRAAGLTDVVVAIHASDADTHDWLTGLPGSFRRGVTAARRAHAAGLMVYLSTVLTRTTTPMAARMVLLARSVGATSIRFTPCREAGAAVSEVGMLAPRLSLVAEVLAAAAEVGRESGVALEVVGVPLCLGPDLRTLAADRLDVPGVDRRSALATPEDREDRAYGAACAACSLRGVCPGVEAAYARRWGFDELAPVGAPAPAVPDCVDVHVGETDPARTLKQRLVKAQSTGTAAVRFVGPASTTHPDLAGLRKECERLGLVTR